MENGGSSRVQQEQQQQASQNSLRSELHSTTKSPLAPGSRNSSAFERTHPAVEQNTSTVRGTPLITGNSFDTAATAATTVRDKIIQKKSRIQELLGQLRPGRSADKFFSFYEEQQGAMASTRSSLREGLRQAPKVNHPFIPDTAPARQMRSAAQPGSPHHGTPSSHTSNFHAAGAESSNIFDAELVDIDSFEGQDTMKVPMSTRDVYTPGNRPDKYRRQGKETKQGDFYDAYYPLQNLEIPKGYNIYKHVHYGLQCGIPEEVDFALFHLVQMSNSRGDKLRFEGFPLMMEALMEKAMEITELCTGVKWELERDQYKWPEKQHRPNVLNTLWGTRDILIRIRKLPIIISDDTLEDEKFSHHLRNIKEATLILRNMCLLPANAIYIATFAKGLLRDFLCVMINIPNQPRFNELKNDALDIAEEVTKFLPTASYDPVCISLYRCISSTDRAHIIRALWAITHFASEVPEAKNEAILNVAHHYVSLLATYLLNEPDGEMLNGTMDFFYQYTLDPSNVEYLIGVVNIPVMFIPRMINLLSHETVEEVHEIELQPQKLAPASTTIPKAPPELSSQLMALAEPERSSQWLRCCFVEDPDCEITQIALWQAYQIRFGGTSGALAAADFIKNVSATFTTAQAQVVPSTGANGQATTKFIIKGIRPLETPLTFNGWPYLFCRWSEKPGQFCDRAFAEARDLRKHVFVEHLDLEASEQPNQYNWDKAKKSPKTCLWEGCTRYRTPSTEVETVVNHVGGHLAQECDRTGQPPTPQRRILQHRLTRTIERRDTPTNEAGEPVGIAYKAALILRNLLWHLPEKIAVFDGTTVSKGDLFLSRRQIIADKLTENRSLRVQMTDIMFLIDQCQEENGTPNYSR